VERTLAQVKQLKKQVELGRKQAHDDSDLDNNNDDSNSTSIATTNNTDASRLNDSKRSPVLPLSLPPSTTTTALGVASVGVVSGRRVRDMPPPTRRRDGMALTEVLTEDEHNENVDIDVLDVSYDNSVPSPS
jgi:hypothetical protein